MCKARGKRHYSKCKTCKLTPDSYLLCRIRPDVATSLGSKKDNLNFKFAYKNIEYASGEIKYRYINAMLKYSSIKVVYLPNNLECCLNIISAIRDYKVLHNGGALSLLQVQNQST